MLQESSPELKETLEGLAPIYAQIIFLNRVEQGYSQKELAEKAKVGLKTISRAEGGYDNLSTETYTKIFKVLNLSIQDIAKAMLELNAGKNDHAATII